MRERLSAICCGFIVAATGAGSFETFPGEIYTAPVASVGTGPHPRRGTRVSVWEAKREPTSAIAMHVLQPDCDAGAAPDQRPPSRLGTPLQMERAQSGLR
jgi:hypothetical protein